MSDMKIGLDLSDIEFGDIDMFDVDVLEVSDSTVVPEMGASPRVVYSCSCSLSDREVDK